MLHQIFTRRQDFDADDRAVGSVVHRDVLGEPLHGDFCLAGFQANVCGIDLRIIGNFHRIGLLTSKPRTNTAVKDRFDAVAQD